MPARTLPAIKVLRIAIDPTMSALTFKELTASIRCVPETDDLRGLYSVYDAIRLVGGDNEHVSRVWSRIVAGKPAWKDLSRYLFPGKGQTMTPVVDATTLILIVWSVPGSAAKKFRRQCADWIPRLMDLK
jgi:hypothetical protein